MAIVRLLVVLTALLAISSLPRSDAESSVIHVLTILPYPTDYIEPSWSEGHNVIPAMNLAVEMINSRSDILPGYDLDLVNVNGGCDFINEALISFTSQIVHPEYQPGTQIAGLIGPGCSASTLAVLPLVNREQVTLINIHGAGSHLIENRTLYPNSLGILGSTRDFAHAVFALMRRADWTRVAAVFEEARTFFFSIYQAFLDDIKSETNGTVAFASTLYSTYYPLSEIRDSGLRIIIVMVGPTLARNLLCLAYHEGMLYPDYQWILVSRDVGEFNQSVQVDFDGVHYECNQDLFINTILRGNLLLNYQLSPFDNTSETHSGLNFVDFSKKYNEKLEEYNQNVNVSARFSIWAGMYFDAVWALALAFDGSGVDVGAYQGGNSDDTITLRNALYSLNFEGVSGKVLFNNQTGFVKRRINIHQVFDGETIFIAYVADGSVIKVQHPEYIPGEFKQESYVVLPVTVVFAIVTGCLATLVVTLHIFTVVYRKHASIKATSPKLNHFIYFGSYLWIAATVSYITYSRIDQLVRLKLASGLCQAIWSWFLPMGYTLMFGMVTARTWRLYRIFTHYLNPGPLISNKVLIGFVFSLLVFDVIIATTWTIVDPFQIDNITHSVADNAGAITVRTIGCNCKYLFVWSLLIYGYRVALLAATIVLSVLTRHIRNRKFTTKFLRVFVYLVALVFIMGGSLYYLTFFISIGYSIAVSIFLTTADAVVVLVIVLLFFPPVWPVLRGKFEPVYQSLLTKSSISLASLDSKLQTAEDIHKHT